MKDTVICVFEESHGLILITTSMRAAIVALINKKWITAGLEVWEDNLTISLAEYCKKHSITRENFLDWAVYMAKNTDFWEEYFYFHRFSLDNDEKLP